MKAVGIGIVGKVIRSGVILGAVLACLPVQGETGTPAPAEKGLVTGEYGSFIGTWTVFYKFAGDWDSFTPRFTPSGLFYNGLNLYGAWNQSGIHTSWQYMNSGTLYMGTMTSVYSMTGMIYNVSGTRQGSWYATRTYAPGMFYLTAVSNSVQEGTTKKIKINRLYGDDGVVSVNYAVVAGSALAGQDYFPKSGTISWADKDSAEKIVKIPILADGKTEGVETFSIQLKKPVNGYLGTTVKETLYILPNNK